MSCYSTIIKIIEFIVNEKQNFLEWKKYKFKRLLSDIICIQIKNKIYRSIINIIRFRWLTDKGIKRFKQHY